MTIRQREIIIKISSFLFSLTLYVFLLIALIRCSREIVNVKIGDCYKKLGELTPLCVTDQTHSFVELTDSFGNKQVVLKLHLEEEPYIRIDKKHGKD